MAGVMETDACLVLERPERRDGSDRFRLQTMRNVLVEELDIIEIDKLLDLLYAKDIFNTAEKNKVFYERVPEDKMRKLLDILETKADIPQDPPVLNIVVDFLKDTCGNEELARRLIEAEGTPKGYTDADEALELAKGVELTDKILGGVITRIGPTWESVALELDISHIKIENIKSVNRDLYQQKFKVFYAWKQKSGYLPGSLVVLLKAFKNNYDLCKVDWPGICNYLRANKE